MDYFLSGGQAVAGFATLVLLWLTLSFVGRRSGHKPLSSMGFALWPSLFLLWLVGGCILILRGIGAV
jgi:hypothetical protein